MLVLTVDAILFGLDGTLVDSTPGVVKAWHTFARDYGLDAAHVAHTSHGRRLCDTLKEYCLIDNEEQLEVVLLAADQGVTLITTAFQAEIMRFEQEVLAGGSVVLPGALALLQQIGAGNTETASGWTIVTSATNVYAPRAMQQCGIPLPPLGLITSNDVTNGKPHPAPYLAGARRLGVQPSRCVVVDDAPSGILSSRAAGCKVIAVCTSHSRQALTSSGAKPDYIVKDLSRLSARWIGETLELSIDESDA